MENRKPPFFFSFARVYCTFFGHRYRVSKLITDHIKEYRCAHCGEEMTDTANGFMARLTPRFRETNEFIAKIHQRRRNRHTFPKAS